MAGGAQSSSSARFKFAMFAQSWSSCAPPSLTEVCLVSDSDANLPSDRAVWCNCSATLALGGGGQDIGLAVRGLQREMMVSVPAAAIEPEAQGIVFRRIPYEF